MTFAPSIVYIGPDEKKALIAGHSLEVNARGDLQFTVSLGQIRLKNLEYKSTVGARVPNIQNQNPFKIRTFWWLLTL